LVSTLAFPVLLPGLPIAAGPNREYNVPMKHTTLRWALVPLLFLFSLPIFAQPPDCQFTFTASAAAPGIAHANKGPQCASWRFTYYSAGFTGVSIQVEAAPDVAGSPGAWAVVPLAAVSEASCFPTGCTAGNPTLADQSGTFVVRTYFPWIRVNLTAATGPGFISSYMYGYKGTTATAGGGVVCPAGTPPGTVCTGPAPQLVWTYKVLTPIANRTTDLVIFTAGGADCTVYWGDGTAFLAVGCSTGGVTHTYASDGPWTISVVGPLAATSPVTSLLLGNGLYSGGLTFDPLLPFPGLIAFTYANTAAAPLPASSPFFFNPNLTTIQIAINPSLASVPAGWFDPVIGLTSLDIALNPLLTTLPTGMLAFNLAVTTATLSANAFNVNSVNTLLFELASTVGSRAICNLDLSGGTSAAPTIGPPDGIAAVIALTGAGWTVTTN
jgi:hypothetical protein